MYQVMVKIMIVMMSVLGVGLECPLVYQIVIMTVKAVTLLIIADIVFGEIDR